MTTHSATTIVSDSLIATLLPLIRQAGQIALDHQQSFSLILKPDLSPVTTADTAVEEFLIPQLLKLTPGARVLAEETGLHAGDHSIVWVLDPIDGTRSYASQLPVWGVALALLVDGKPVWGCYYQPALDTLTWAGQSTLSHRGAETSPTPCLTADHSLAFIAVPSNGYQHFQIDFGRVRALGSTIAHLFYVVNSHCIGALSRSVYAWDIAAALPALQLARADLRYLSGASFELAPLLDGRAIPEPLLVTPPGLWDLVRARVTANERPPELD